MLVCWLHIIACENARLVPKEQAGWFNYNKMSQYNRRGVLTGINDVANGVCLRSDVHDCLNRHGFVFFPTNEGKFVAYIIGNLEDDYAVLLHRRPVMIHERVAEEFIYARFAYAFINTPRASDFDAVTIPAEANVTVRERRSTNLKEETVPSNSDSDSIPEDIRACHLKCQLCLLF